MIQLTMAIAATHPDLDRQCQAQLTRSRYQIYSRCISDHERGYMGETRGERFKRLAQARGDRLIREISLLGNLANRKNYDYTPKEVQQLFEPIERELQEIRALFDPATPSTRKVNFK
jgi:hypothetical protein